MSSNHIFARVGRAVGSMTTRVYNAIGAGPLGRLFTSYQTADNYFRCSSLARSLRGKEKKRNNHSLRRGLAAAMDQSILRRAAYGMVNGLCRCSLRTLGAFFVTVGVYTALITWLIATIWQNVTPDGLHLFFAGAMLLIGFVLCFSTRSVAYMLARGQLMGKLLHACLGLSDEYIRDFPEKGKTMYTAALPLGMLAGTITAITGPVYPMLALLVTVLVMIALTTPEAGILLMLVFSPFIGMVPYSELCLCVGVCLSFAGYMFKLMRGTRAFRMEIQDLAVLVLLVFTLFSGVSAAGGSAFTGVLLSALLMMVYFPAVNVLSTPTWLSRCRWGVLFSAGIVALVGVLQYAVAILLAVQEFRTLSMETLGESVRAGFSSHATFAYFMVLVFPFALHAFIRAKNSRHRVVAGFVTICALLSGVLTWLPGAWIAFLVEILVLMLFCNRATFPYVLFLLCLIPVAFLLLPAPYRDAVLAFLGRGEMFAGTRMGVKILFGGEDSAFRILFGVGAQGAERIGVLYTQGSVEAVTSSLNFWWRQWIEGGVLMLAATVVLFFFLLQNCMSLLSRTSKEQSAVAPVSGVCMALGAIAISFFQCTWEDPVALLLFFILLSVVTADARVRRADHVAMEPIEQSACCAEMEYRVKKNRRKKLSVEKEVDHEQ